MNFTRYCRFVVCRAAAFLLIAGLLAAPGCQRAAESNPSTSENGEGNSTGALAAAGADGEIHSPDPATAVMQYLEAYRIGDDSLAMRMLTARARDELAKGHFHPNRMESKTAEFTVGQVNFVGANHESAHVASSWSDYDERKELHTQELIVILRKEGPNWRVAGLAFPAGPGESATVMNFENSAEMKVRWDEFESTPTRVGSLPR